MTKKQGLGLGFKVYGVLGPQDGFSRKRTLPDHRDFLENMRRLLGPH